MKVSGQIHILAALSPGKSHLYPLDRRLVGPRAGLDAVEKRKISCPCRESNPGSCALSPSVYQLSYGGSYYISFSELVSCFWHTFLLIGMFELKIDEVAGGWRKVHDKELHNLYTKCY
jgi:hypothetical protein